MQIVTMLQLLGLLAAAPDTDGRIIVHRHADAVQIFASLPGADVSAWSGVPAGIFTDPGGAVDFDRFRVDTGPLGDRVFAEVALSLGGAEAGMEALAFMLHDADLPTEFTTPWDAISTITFCAAGSSDAPSELTDVVAYGGWLAYPVDGFADLRLDFPETGRAVMRFDLWHYVDGRLVDRDVVTLGDAGALNLPALRQR